MRKLMFLPIFAMVTVWALAFPATAPAQEWDPYVSLYAGYAMPSNTDVKVEGPGVSQTYHSVELKSSLAWGGKLGIWNTETRDVIGVDVGLELDVLNYYPSNNTGKRYNVTGPGIPAGSTGSPGQVDLNSTMATLNLLVRLPLVDSQEFPNGRLFPYVGGGAGVDRADYKGDGSSGTAYDLAYQAKGGIEFFITTAVSMFAEAKYTMTNHTFKDSVGNNYRYDFNVLHGVAGLALHF